MNTHEYRTYFDQHGPELAEQQPPTRRERVAVSQQPLGGLGVAGALVSPEAGVVAQSPYTPEQ
jgi:hypothetical protein